MHRHVRQKGLDEPDIFEVSEYKLKGRETYVRAECIDMYGRKAWTNPIFLK